MIGQYEARTGRRPNVNRGYAPLAIVRPPGRLSRFKGWVKSKFTQQHYRDRELERLRSIHSDAINAAYIQLKSVTSADLIPSFNLNRKLWPEFNAATAISEGLEQSVWVYTCAMRLALAMSLPRWEVARIGSKEALTKDQHPLAKLLSRPNQEMSWRDMVQTMTLHLFLSGNSITSKIAGYGGAPIELWPMDPGRAQYTYNKRGITSYAFYVPGEEDEILRREQAVHLRFNNPSNPFWGLSPMKAGAKAVEIDRLSSAWQASLLNNGMVPPGVFKVKRTMSPAQLEEFKEELGLEWAGADNAGTPLVIGNDVEFQRLAEPARELDHTGSKIQNAHEVCAIMLTPPPMVGLLDRATYNNVTTVRRVWWEDTLTPLLQAMVDGVAAQVLPDYRDGESLELRVDISDVPAFLDILERKADILMKLIEGTIPPNSARKLVGLEVDPVEGGDIALIKSSLVSLNMLSGGSDGF